MNFVGTWCLWPQNKIQFEISSCTCEGDFEFFNLKDLPIGLMDDIYDFMRKFTERLDEVEDLVRQLLLNI